MIRITLELTIDSQGMELDIMSGVIGTIREVYLADGSTLPVAEAKVLELAEDEA